MLLTGTKLEISGSEKKKIYFTLIHRLDRSQGNIFLSLLIKSVQVRWFVPKISITSSKNNRIMFQSSVLSLKTAIDDPFLIAGWSQRAFVPEFVVHCNLDVIRTGNAPVKLSEAITTRKCNESLISNWFLMMKTLYSNLCGFCLKTSSN